MEGFKIIQPSDVRDSLRKHRDTYHDRGKYLGWESFHRHYSMQLGTCTDWTGSPRSGKTQVLMELLINTSKWYGWKHLVYFPDVGSPTEIVADLIHKVTGKPFDPKAGNTITNQEIDRELDWILNHFSILTKADVKAKLTPFQFWDYAVHLKKTEGLHTACIDSWKDMSHPYDKYGGYATYLEVVLPYRNQLAEDNGLHFHNIIHPKLPDKDRNGVRLAPNPYDLKGGSEWFNSGKSMITVHREDVLDNEVDIIFHKAKPRSVGFLGSVKMRFDVDRLVYYAEEENGGRLYAAPKGKEQIETNTGGGLALSPEMSNFDDAPF